MREAPEFWGKMALIAKQPQSEDEIQPPEILSTHPAHESRMVRLTELLPLALETRRLCGCAKLQQDFRRAVRRVGPFATS